ncbi:MAG: hypothetical protein WD397_05555 [Wenzhouxiangellaceae bacterium]
MIQVYLERLRMSPEHVSDHVRVRDYLKESQQPEPEECRVVKISAAAIPALRIGGVFNKGRPIGSLKFPATTIEFDRSVDSSRIMTVGDEFEPSPPWWRDGLPYRLINRGEFRVPDLGSNCLILTQNVEGRRIDVVIPCTEVFRSLYARESKVIREMLAAPWRDAVEKIVNSQLTGPVDRSTWQVVLRRGMSERFPEYVANLVLNPDGSRAANHIHGVIPMGARSWHLRAPLPFEMKKFRLQGRMLVLREEDNFTKLLCTEIMGCSYPLRGIDIRYVLENDARQGDDKIKAGGSPPFGKVYAGIVEEDEPISNTSEEDPSAESLSLYHDAEGSGWLDDVRKNKCKKAVSKVYQRPHKDDEGPRLNRTSAGEASWGRSSSAPGQFKSDPEYSKRLVERFEHLLAMMQQLLRDGKIEGYQTIGPSESDSKYAAYQDFIPLWKLPNYLYNDELDKLTYRPWAVVPKPSPRSRTLIVVEIHWERENLLWFDLEPKSRGHCALLLRVGTEPPGLNRIIHYVRSLSVRTLGRWYEDKQSKEVVVPGALKAVRWQHCHTQDGLNGLAAINALQKLFKP